MTKQLKQIRARRFLRKVQEAMIEFGISELATANSIHFDSVIVLMEDGGEDVFAALPRLSKTSMDNLWIGKDWR